MMTPFAPAMTPKKHGDAFYHGCIYFNPQRDPYVAAKDQVIKLSEKLKTPIEEGDVIVPVRVYEWRDNEAVYWHRPKNERALVSDHFPNWLPLRLLLAARENQVIEIEIDPLNRHQSVPYNLLCTQDLISRGATFETWYQNPDRAKVFNYSQHYADYLNRTVPVITRSIAQPHFDEELPTGRAKISLKPTIEAEQEKGRKDFTIRVWEDGQSADLPVDPELLKKYSAFFRKALNSGELTHHDGIVEINCSISLMRELVYFLNCDCFHHDITLNSCLGLISLNSTFGKEKQNREFEEAACRAIKEKLSKETSARVIAYAHDNTHVQLIEIVEEFLKGQKLNLIGLGIYSAKDCIKVYKEGFPELSELIAVGIREELILHGNPILWKEAFETAKEYRKTAPLFDELYRICEDIAKKNPDVLG